MLTSYILAGNPARENAYRAIDGERDYQEAGKGNARTDRQSTSVGEHVLMLVGYTNQAVAQWNGPHPEGREAAMNTMRKIAAIAVRCMEEHGAPLRS